MKNAFITLIFALCCYYTSQSQITIILQPGAEQGKDALLHGLVSEANRNYGKTPQISANAWTFKGIEGVVRSVFDFDFKWIPKKLKINSAFLTLYSWESDGGMGRSEALSGSNDCWLERVVSDWDENTVTWNTQPQSTEQNRIGFQISNGEAKNEINIDVTKLVEDMIKDRKNSFGFMIKLQNEEYYRRVNFYSSDYTDASKWPKLTINCSIK